MEKNTNKEKAQTEIKKEKPIKTIWVSVSTASQIGGVEQKTIRRAIQSHKIIYKVIKDRYTIDLFSVIKFLHSSTKLKNKLKQNGIGQIISEWEEMKNNKEEGKF